MTLGEKPRTKGHTTAHTSQSRALRSALNKSPLRDVFRRSWTCFYSVWGRVVADIPDFNRKLVAALAEG